MQFQSTVQPFPFFCFSPLSVRKGLAWWRSKRRKSGRKSIISFKPIWRNRERLRCHFGSMPATIKTHRNFDGSQTEKVNKITYSYSLVSLLFSSIALYHETKHGGQFDLRKLITRWCTCVHKFSTPALDYLPSEVLNDGLFVNYVMGIRIGFEWGSLCKFVNYVIGIRIGLFTASAIAMQCRKKRCTGSWISVENLLVFPTPKPRAIQSI